MDMDTVFGEGSGEEEEPATAAEERGGPEEDGAPVRKKARIEGCSVPCLGSRGDPA